jgi:hypothetical protein
MLAAGCYNSLFAPGFSWEHGMEREFIDRAENIQARILQLRDSL